jgi:hypothetical protein
MREPQGVAVTVGLVSLLLAVDESVAMTDSHHRGDIGPARPAGRIAA